MLKLASSSSIETLRQQLRVHAVAGRTALGSLVMSAAASKTRYLRALGFEPRVPQDESDARSSSPSPSSSELLQESANPADRGTKGPRAKGPRAKGNSSTKAHVEWLSADGEWVRGNQVIAASTPAPYSTNPLTLAGPVAIESESELSTVWARFKETEKQADRDDLIVYYAPLVKYVASRIAAGLPQTVDQADLISYGMFGLIDAITKFDPERGFKFETYAVSRIKGAVLDELRSIDWVPRSVRSKAKSVERAMSKLEAQYHRPPTDSEIAEELDITETQLSNIYKQISSLGMVALDEMLAGGGSETLTFGDTLADRRDGPGMTYERAEVRQLLAQAINKMSEREKIVLTLYYYENLTLAEIGKVLGVTESRVCQIHTKAVLQLRSRFDAAERVSA